MHKSYNKDRQNIIKNGAKICVEKAIITGSSIKSSIEASEYESKYPGVLYSTAGVHPHDAKTCDKNTLSILEDLAKNESVVAIGECGLFLHRD